jgi:uncharacterized protein YneR
LKIDILDSALKWFKDEIGVQSGDKVKFHIQIYGSSPIQQGYSLGFVIEDPLDAAVSTELEGILFYIEKGDVWFFNGHDLHVRFNEQNDELEYEYTQSD